MAKAHSASYVLATEPASVHGSMSNPWKDGLDEIKLEIASLKVMITSVQKEIGIIRGKAEEVSRVCVAFLSSIAPLLGFILANRQITPPIRLCDASFSDHHISTM